MVPDLQAPVWGDAPAPNLLQRLKRLPCIFVTASTYWQTYKLPLRAVGGLDHSGSAVQWWTLGGEGTSRSGYWGEVCSSFVRWPQGRVLEVAAVPAAVPCARRHARRTLGGWGVPGPVIGDA